MPQTGKKEKKLVGQRNASFIQILISLIFFFDFMLLVMMFI